MIEEMRDIQATLLRLKVQKEQVPTLKRPLDEYNSFIRKQHALNLYWHTFVTANIVLDPGIRATLEYS